MEQEQRFTSVGRSHPAIRKPKGYSVIDHSIRFQLELSVEEYIMVDLLYQHNKAYSVGAMNVMKYFTTIGFAEDDIKRVGKQLRAKGLIETDTVKKRPVTTNLWNDFFDDEKQFETLWKVHHKGNKKEAKINFQKMKGMIPFNSLIEKLQNYVNSKADSPTYLRDLSGWLNPKFERWEDEIDYQVNSSNAGVDTSMPTKFFNR